jgi:hypothetical protein
LFRQFVVEKFLGSLKLNGTAEFCGTPLESSVEYSYFSFIDLMKTALKCKQMALDPQKNINGVFAIEVNIILLIL